jgi:hypothetical protein
MKTKLLLPLNLQFFSEEPPATPAEPPTETPVTPEEPKFTQADLERIVGERLAREKAKTQKQIDDAKAEAERLKLVEANDYKVLYEAEKDAREQERAQAQAERLNTKKQSLLLEAGYPADKLADLLDFVTGEDEEAVKASVDKLMRVAPPKAAPIDPAVSGGNRQQATQETLKEKGRKRFDELRAKGLL